MKIKQLKLGQSTVIKAARMQHSGKKETTHFEKYAITKWKTGTMGGLTEAEYAEIIVPKKLSSTELSRIEKEAHLHAGSPFGKEQPKEEKTSTGYKYTWAFFPSTE
jgi:hypothetical protein